jgi:hypothetical protein
MATSEPLRCASCTRAAITTDEYLLVVNEGWRWHTATAIYCPDCTSAQFNQNLTPRELSELTDLRRRVVKGREFLAGRADSYTRTYIETFEATLVEAREEADAIVARANARAAQAAPETAPTEDADMSDDVASLETLVRENSGGTITRDSRQATGVEFSAGEDIVAVHGDGWMFTVRYDEREGVQLEPARMALVALCCDLGKMIASGEYAEGMARAAKGEYLPRMECGGIWLYDSEFDEIMSRQPTADGYPS